jgi:branched-chain amino acid transport system substrate-binding protein
MILPKQISPGNRIVWLLSILSLIVLASQCKAPPGPPLPSTPTGPVIRIALLSPDAGELATFGRRMRNGSLMAFDEWNERGGLHGYYIEWTIYDTNCDFETARQVTQRAIDDGLKFMIGPVCSEAAIGAATVAESAQALMISPTATHSLVTVDGQGRTRPTIFRMSYTSSGQAKAVAHFARNNLKLNKAAILFDHRDDYATALAETFARQFAVQGGEIVYQNTHMPNDSDLTDKLNAISQVGAKVIYLPADAATVNQVAHRLNELGLSKSSTESETGLILLGSDSWESPELDLAATTGSYFPTHFMVTNERPLLQAWAEAYKATYAIEPDTLAALGYEAATILAVAIERAGTFEPVAVAKALEQGNFEGITGQITFDDQHNPIKSVPIVYIDQKRLVFSTFISP